MKSNVEQHECFVGLTYILERGWPGLPAPRERPVPDTTLRKQKQAENFRRWKARQTLDVANL